jgi:hypothetical protein
MLTQLGKKHNTDKCGHITNGKSYLDIYEQYFNNIKSNTLNILEIGIRDGCSLRMWKEYFHNSNIIGLDIDPRCSSMGEERIKVFNKILIERLKSDMSFNHIKMNQI